MQCHTATIFKQPNKEKVNTKTLDLEAYSSSTVHVIEHCLWVFYIDSSCVLMGA